ncbi:MULTISPECIES: STAS-like domain-containing protein [unclassified Mesorhizobium]|uniref:STAS-like domain-containing protein n=1 Tax=unclassified Mesorhizobium TaxID=325217 RepID=UPI00333A9970
MQTIRVAEDFSATPGGRYLTDGPFSGEDFRERLLIPALSKGSPVTVILDGTRGYPSSFLDEAFAGLARKMGWTRDQFTQRVKIVASDQYKIYQDDIYHYIEVSQRRSK